MRDPSLPRIVERVPLSYRVFSWLSKHRLRGAERFRRMAMALGWLDVAAWVPVSDAPDPPKVLVPFASNPYPCGLVRTYESWILDAIRPVVASLPGRILLVDAGADIGLMTLRLSTLASRSRWAGIVAIEPNSQSSAFLRHSLGVFDGSARVVQAGVGASAGRGALRRPEYDPDSAQAAFIEPADDGEIEIVSLDSLQVPPFDSLLLKLDVEGAEFEALAGGERLLSRAHGWCVLLEVHALALRRAGRTPAEIVQKLLELGASEAFLAEDGRPLIRGGIVADYTIPNAICNIVASRAAHA